MITAVRGIRVGHWDDPVARTGCTVALFPAGTVASGEVRGGAPGTREFELLAPSRTVQSVSAVVMAGGSAFGLAACDGVMGWCEERGIGFPTAGGVVPIVVGMVVYDLAVGDPKVRPSAASGVAACVAATDQTALGAVGVGAGCTIDKWRGREHARPGGLVGAVVRDGDVVVASLVAVNAYGGLVGAPGTGATAWPVAPFEEAAGNTVIGIVATNASLGKDECFLVAQGAHDGLARTVDPPHTGADGDAFVAAAVGGPDAPSAPVDQVRWLALRAVEDAIRTLA